MLHFPRAARRAARSLRRTPAFTAAAVLTLALGIGATTAIFSVVDGVMLRPLPYANADRLVGVWFAFPGVGVPQAGMSDGTYLKFRRDNRVFEDIGVYSDEAANVTGGGEAERVSVARVTASLMPTLRATPLRGRLISPEDDRPNGPRVAIISEGLWRRKFGGEPGAVGRTIQLDGQSYEIIGVMPARFRYPTRETQVWTPIAFDPAHAALGGFNFPAVARLKPGVTIAGATADLSRLLARLPNDYPEIAPGSGTSTRELFAKARPSMIVHPMRDDVVGDVGKVLWVILGTVGFVLLVACANVANLFLVRADGRQRELAVRAAIGAGREEVARQFVTEGLVLAGAGGAIGVALAYAGLRVLTRVGAADIPRIDEVGLDGRTLGVALAVTLGVALLCSALPILRFTGRDLSPLLREGGRSATQGRDRQRARRALVVSQVALALVLLAASGLMARSFWELRAVKPGFDASHAVALRLSLPGATYPSDERVGQFWEQAVDRVASLPGVRAVGAVTRVPLGSGGENRSILWVENARQEGVTPPVLMMASIAGDYFRAAGIPLLAGRAPARFDGVHRVGEAVVSAMFAEHWFGDRTGRAALGRRVRRSPQGSWYTIVGVAGDVRATTLDAPPEETVYFPAAGYAGQWEDTPHTLSLVVRTAGEPTRVVAAAEREIRALDPALPVFGVHTLRDLVRASMARTSFTMLLLGTASGIALLLGVIGIYGVVAYAVSLRTREIGVRIALGARPASVSRMVTRQGLVLAGAGVAAGLAGAAVVTRFLAALLYGVTPGDPVTLGGAALTLLGAAAFASWVPARRAARVDPTTALRSD